jgi:hypothetical protein
MFDAIDEAIKTLLIREIPIRQNEIEISFDQPTQDWSARISGPTLNLYLYDIRENRALRGSEQFSETQLPDGRVEIRRNPVRIDLHYLITAWTRKEQDQHHLLGLAMMALLRCPFIPEEVCPESLKNHPIPMPIEVARVTDELKSWSDFWTTMNNRMRPGLTLTITLLVDPYRPTISTMVQSSEVKFQQKGDEPSPKLSSKKYLQVGGEIVSEKYDPSTLSLLWEEKGIAIEIQNGHFAIPSIEPGVYHLSVRYNDRVLKRHKFTVPLQERLKIEI